MQPRTRPTEEEEAIERSLQQQPQPQSDAPTPANIGFK